MPKSSMRRSVKKRPSTRSGKKRPSTRSGKRSVIRSVKKRPSTRSGKRSVTRTRIKSSFVPSISTISTPPKPFVPSISTISTPPKPFVPEIHKKDVIFGPSGIGSLSGPISFYYLRPKQEVYNDRNGKYFPLIILFGDRHRSMEDICEKCTCSIDRTKGCCYSLSDPEFLKQLDTLASTQYPVDFYTETFLSGTERGFKGGVMAELTTGEMVSCYNHLLRGTEKDKCPTKNIRWQAGDTRQAGGSFISKHNDGFLYYGNDSFMKNVLYEKNEVGKKLLEKDYERQKYIEYQFDQIAGFLVEYIEIYEINNTNIELAKLLANAIKKIFGEDEDSNIKNIFTMKRFQQLLLTLCDGDGDSFNFENFAKAFFQLFTKENSLIYKQIQKQSYAPFRQIKEWADFYQRSLEFNYISFPYKDKITKQTLKETILKLPSLLSNPEDISSPEKGILSTAYPNLYFVSTFSLGFLDIYTIARIWKQPTGGNRSSLSFCYFGNSHIKSIVHLLQSTNAYELVQEKKSEKRCQIFDFNLNLSEEVRLHNQQIDL